MGPMITDPETPRRGRPPRINRAMIAEAAHEIGLDGLTLRAVADRLDVSIAALYHHVSGKEDLLRMVAEESTRAVPLPVDEGQHWAQWLCDWAHYNHDIFAAQPGLLEQYMGGAVGLDAVVHNLDRILDVLVREGFEVGDANTAYSLVSSCAIGAVVGEHWEGAAGQEDGDFATAFRRVVAAAPKRQLTRVRQLAKTKRLSRRESLDRRIDIVLEGIAAEYGLAWQPVTHPPAA
jgi:AcrR family transcriptional regulator